MKKRLLTSPDRADGLGLCLINNAGFSFAGIEDGIVTETGRVF